MTRRLPKPTEPVVDARGLITRAWNDYLRRPESIDVTDDLKAQIEQIRKIIDDLPANGFLPSTTNVFGQYSVVQFGTLAGGIVFLQLANDVDTPYAFQYYGADEAGNRGWRWLYDALAAGSGIVKTMDGFSVLGVLETTGELPASSDVGDAYLIDGRLWAWDGADWVDEGDASGVTMFSHADTSSVADISAEFTGGTVPWQIEFTFDQFGHVLTRNITGRTLDHNDTGGLQGGNATERYHFTEDEHTGLLPWATESPDDFLQPGDNVSELVNDAGYVVRSDFSGALVAFASAQSLPDNTDTKLTFGAETYDTDGYHDNVVNPSRLTVPTDGVYVVSAGALFAANSTGWRRIQLFKNDAAFPGRLLALQGAVTVATGATGTSAPIVCSAGDYFEVGATQTSGGALNVLQNNGTWFAIRRVADLST